MLNNKPTDPVNEWQSQNSNLGFSGLQLGCFHTSCVPPGFRNSICIGPLADYSMHTNMLSFSGIYILLKAEKFIYIHIDFIYRYIFAIYIA